MSGTEHLKFSEEHEWIDADDDMITVGITEYAQENLGDIVYIELPDVGNMVTKDESVGSIESVKAVSDLFSPVSGEVIEINEEVIEAQHLVNSDPYGKGWLMKIRIEDQKELDDLMDEDAYQEFIG